MMRTVLVLCLGNEKILKKLRERASEKIIKQHIYPLGRPTL